MRRHIVAMLALAVLAGTPAASLVCAAMCATPAAEPAASSCAPGHAAHDTTLASPPAVPPATLAPAPAPCCAHETAGVVASRSASRHDVPGTMAAVAAMDAFAVAGRAAGGSAASVPRPPHPRSVPGAPLVLRI